MENRLDSSVVHKNLAYLLELMNSLYGDLSPSISAVTPYDYTGLPQTPFMKKYTELRNAVEAACEESKIPRSLKMGENYLPQSRIVVQLAEIKKLGDYIAKNAKTSPTKEIAQKIAATAAKLMQGLPHKPPSAAASFKRSEVLALLKHRQKLKAPESEPPVSRSEGSTRLKAIRELLAGTIPQEPQPGR